MDQFRNPDVPDPDENTSKMLCHCETLKQLLEELPLPSPPQDEILEILKSNVQLFAAFIKLDAEPLVDDESLNQLQNHKSVEESQNRQEVPYTLREPNFLLSGRLDSLLSAEKRTENDVKPPKSDSDLKVVSEPPVTIGHSLINTRITERVKSQPTSSSSIVQSSTPKVSTLPPLSFSQPKAVKPKKVFTPEQMENFAKEYQRIYKLDPGLLSPFQPINRFPFKYVVAQHTFFHGYVSHVLFVRNTLMLGDGYAYGVSNYVMRSGSTGCTLDHFLYNNSLSIPQLAEAIRRFPRLPEKVLLSIGNYDGLFCNDIYAVRREYLGLLQTLRSLGVSKLHVLPLMYVPGATPHYQAVADMVMSDWSTPFGGEYEYTFQQTLIQKILSSAQQPQLGFDMLNNDWRKIVDAIRNYFVTEGKQS